MQNKQLYGVDRLYEHLRTQCHQVSQYMVRILKKEHGIKCRHHKHFKVSTTQNFLDQKSDTNQPNKTWVSDIT